jgi:hypothetical protein
MGNDIPGRAFSQDPDITDLSARSKVQQKTQEEQQIEADKDWSDRMDPISDTAPSKEPANVRNLTRTLTNTHLDSNGKPRMKENTQSGQKMQIPHKSNTAQNYIALYGSIIANDFSSQALANSPLPANRQLLQEVSRHMADEMYDRYVMGFSALLPPLNHPLYPYWLLEHKGNYAVKAMLEKEEEEPMEF